MNIFSSVSRLQEASLHAIDSYNTQWVIDSCDPNERFEKQGEPVRAGEPILIRHCQTEHYLGSDCVVEKNDFGSEYEVSTNSFNLLNKTQNLELEKKGHITTDVPTRFQQDQNVWCFETAPNASFDQSIDQLQKFNIGDLMGDLAKFCAEKSSADKVRACFQAIDTKGSKCVDCDDFRWGMIDLGYQLSEREANEICQHFGGEQLNYEDFISKVCC